MEIARKTDLGTSYVREILKLLQDGEDGLLRAVERGQIPVGIAVTISREDDKAVQKALAELYESNRLRGKDLLVARRLIERRKLKKAGGAASGNDQGMSADRVLRTYQRETQRQKAVVQQARICGRHLLVAVSAVRQLLEDESFVDLLKAEGLDSLPQFLADEIYGREAKR